MTNLRDAVMFGWLVLIIGATAFIFRPLEPLNLAAQNSVEDIR